LPVVFLREQLRHSNDQHVQIFQALKTGNGDVAEQVAREHIESTLNIVAEALSDS
jgi:DNA-binding GntR family transcriptional regulator